MKRKTIYYCLGFGIALAARQTTAAQVLIRLRHMNSPARTAEIVRRMSSCGS